MDVCGDRGSTTRLVISKVRMAYTAKFGMGWGGFWWGILSSRVFFENLLAILLVHLQIKKLRLRYYRECFAKGQYIYLHLPRCAQFQTLMRKMPLLYGGRKKCPGAEMHF